VAFQCETDALSLSLSLLKGNLFLLSLCKLGYTLNNQKSFSIFLMTFEEAYLEVLHFSFS